MNLLMNIISHLFTYDDIDVIAGQGTLAPEILEQLSEPIDYVFVAVGGGGLLAAVLSDSNITPNKSNCRRTRQLQIGCGAKCKRIVI